MRFFRNRSKQGPPVKQVPQQLKPAVRVVQRSAWTSSDDNSFDDESLYTTGSPKKSSPPLPKRSTSAHLKPQKQHRRAHSALTGSPAPPPRPQPPSRNSRLHRRSQSSGNPSSATALTTSQMNLEIQQQLDSLQNWADAACTSGINMKDSPKRVKPPPPPLGSPSEDSYSVWDPKGDDAVVVMVSSSDRKHSSVHRSTPTRSVRSNTHHSTRSSPHRDVLLPPPMGSPDDSHSIRHSDSVCSVWIDEDDMPVDVDLFVKDKTPQAASPPRPASPKYASELSDSELMEAEGSPGALRLTHDGLERHARRASQREPPPKTTLGSFDDWRRQREVCQLYKKKSSRPIPPPPLDSTPTSTQLADLSVAPLEVFQDVIHCSSSDKSSKHRQQALLHKERQRQWDAEQRKRAEILRQRELRQQELRTHYCIQRVSGRTKEAPFDEERGSFSSRQDRVVSNVSSSGRLGIVKLEESHSGDIECKMNDEEIPRRVLASECGTSGDSSFTNSVSPLACSVCLLGERTYIALPCMHYSFCDVCVKRLQEGPVDADEGCACPVCNTPNVTFSRVYA